MANCAPSIAPRYKWQKSNSILFCFFGLQHVHLDLGSEKKVCKIESFVPWIIQKPTSYYLYINEQVRYRPNLPFFKILFFAFQWRTVHWRYYWSLFQTMENQDSSVKYLSLRQAESYVPLDFKPATRKSSNCFNRCLEQWRKLDQKYNILTIVLVLILLIASITVGVVSSRGILIYPGM